MSKPAPYRRVHSRVPTLADHTLVRAVDSAPQGRDALSRDAARLWHEIAGEPERALSAMEIASRTGVSRGVVMRAVSDLLRQGRARISRPLGSAPAMELLSDHLGPTYYDPELASAKILVLGPETERTRFAAACGRVVQVGESAPASAHTQAVLTMAQIRLAHVALHLVTAPEPASWPVLWSGLVRDACAVLVVATDRTWPQQGPLIRAARDHHLPLQVVIDYRDGPGPDLEEMTAHLDLGPDQVTLCDVDSSDGTYAALRDVVHRGCRS